MENERKIVIGNDGVIHPCLGRTLYCWNINGGHCIIHCAAFSRHDNVAYCNAMAADIGIIVDPEDKEG